MSLILSTTHGKSHLIHFIDTPGHINFVDEVACAMRLADGILLVVDVVEGVSTSKPSHSQAPDKHT
jgi:116 kDa U5 small nuclear ribonucleoprotein component